MRNFLFVICLGLTTAAAANPYDYKVLRVVDGDTIEFEAKFLPSPLPPNLKLRIYGVDTPEKGGRAECLKEAAMGESATTFSKKMVASGKKIQVQLKEWDKFGGRLLGDLIIDGQSLRANLIKSGNAREYFGDKKKSWCS